MHLFLLPIASVHAGKQHEVSEFRENFTIGRRR